jgi:hypothetical protein
MKLAVLLGLSIVSVAASAFAQSSRPVASTSALSGPAQTNVYFDQSNKRVVTSKAKGMDCVTITCPGTFGKNVTCWKCKSRNSVASPTATTNAAP